MVFSFELTKMWLVQIMRHRDKALLYPFSTFPSEFLWIITIMNNREVSLNIGHIMLNTLKCGFFFIIGIIRIYQRLMDWGKMSRKAIRPFCKLPDQTFIDNAITNRWDRNTFGPS